MQKDYYIPWAIQYYGLLYSKFAADPDPRRSALYRERATLFARQFVYWFDANGAALPFGRSLTYRFAQNSFWAACIWAGLEPLPLPVMKGLIVRNFNWWLGQKMFDRDGILTIGYCYPQMYMAERYNAPGSPYWGMKSFLLLALPDDHPFWSAEAAPMPALERLKPMPYANMLVQRRAGRVTAYAAGVNEGHGHGQFPEKYAKFAYDTRFGFCASRSREVLHQAAPDSMLAFVIDDNVFVRKVSKTWEIEAGAVTAQWSPFPGIEVTTTITPTATGHRRHHEIDSSFDCDAYDCGFAVPNFAPATPKMWKTTPPKPLRRTALHCDGQRRSGSHRLRPQHQPVLHKCPSARREVPYPPRDTRCWIPRSLTKRTDAASLQKNSRFCAAVFLISCAIMRAENTAR